MAIYSSGQLEALTSWIQRDDQDFARIDGVGAVSYSKSLPSGTGYGQITRIWNEFSALTGTKNIDLFSLPLTIFNQALTVNLSGASIRAIQIAQSGSGNLSVTFPFSTLSGTLSIPTSGSILLSHMSGWSFVSTRRFITLSHPTTTRYKISLLATI